MEELIELSRHGVSLRYIVELREQGLTDLEIDDIVELSRHGISPKYIAELRRTGI